MFYQTSRCTNLNLCLRGASTENCLKRSITKLVFLSSVRYRKQKTSKQINDCRYICAGGSAAATAVVVSATDDDFGGGGVATAADDDNSCDGGDDDIDEDEDDVDNCGGSGG